MSSMEENIDKKARQLAIDLQSLMARADYIHNRHEECIVCHSKYKQHYPDGLPCESDDDKKIKPQDVEVLEIAARSVAMCVFLQQKNLQILTPNGLKYNLYFLILYF